MHQTYPSRGEKKNKSDDHYFITNALNSHDKDIDTILKHCAISICEAQNAAHVEKSTSTIWTNKPGVGRWGVIAYTAIKRYKIHVLITRHKSLFLSLSPSLPFPPRTGALRTQKLKTHLLRTQSSKVLPFKPGAGQNIAIRATPTGRDFFLANFYPSDPFTPIFSQTSPEFFLCWLWITTIPVRAVRMK